MILITRWGFFSYQFFSILLLVCLTSFFFFLFLSANLNPFYKIVSIFFFGGDFSLIIFFSILLLACLTSFFFFFLFLSANLNPFYKIVSIFFFLVFVLYFGISICSNGFEILKADY